MLSPDSENQQETSLHDSNDFAHNNLNKIKHTIKYNAASL